MINTFNRFLFLDDIREPEQAFKYTKEKMFIEKNWDVVRNYDEFVAYIETNGLPNFISFDHDLADTHYTPEEYWDDYEKSKVWQESQIHKEKTGYECAKWLVDYCMDNKLRCPDFYCHSMNPVGKDKIVGLLNPFQIAMQIAENSTVDEKLKEYFDKTPQEEIQKEWAKSEEMDKCEGPTLNEFLNTINNSWNRLTSK